MSQSEVYATLAAFGPLRSIEMQGALGLSQASVSRALRLMRKHGEVRYMGGNRRVGRLLFWETV